MLEAKNDNHDKNDLDISENTSGSVGFDPKTGKVFYVDEPKKKVEKSNEPSQSEIDQITAELEANTAALQDLIDRAKAGEFLDKEED